MIIWNGKNLSEALEKEINFEFKAINFEFNSSNVKESTLFIALKGEKGDGHNYINDAFNKGAVAAIVEKLPENNQDKCILVEDTKQALYKIAEFKRKNSQAKFIGITGSVGKTSTKELTAKAFCSFGLTHKTEGNFNNDLGVPITLARMPDETKYAIIEMGMNTKGEILHLAKLVQPDVMVITTIEPVHLEFFDSIEGIVEAKSEIFFGDKPDRIAILNRDNKFFQNLLKNAEKNGITKHYSFGTSNESNAKLISSEVKENSTMVKALIDNHEINYEIAYSGKHHAMNSLAALLAVKALNLEYRNAAQYLNDVAIIKGRGQTFKITVNNTKITLIDEAYNASPASVKATLETTAEKFPKKRKIAILGDMRELGKDEVSMHLELLPYLEKNDFHIITVGKVMENVFNNIKPEYKCKKFENYNDLINDNIVSLFKEDDVILVKGSLSMNLTKVVEYIKSVGE